ncbi:TetR/AcrR family transcriptional regulator [Nocardiopsis ganjiahuensis]|uniref:TetR/AcrR family transcriptional regulator n=1 Tax=Nocardiopsis ganjiahuensis TaxID=239984 RepID=UPI0009FF6AD2|nr:TetR/AcrR family transcriptional regulator [Nocardiopsis ganjiahuensis]
MVRRDAVANRRRILKAARESFDAGGLDVLLSTVARRAAVGEATLHRRFPTKDALVRELFEETVDSYTRIFDAARDHSDPLQGLVYALRSSAALQVRGRVCSPEFAERFPVQQAEHTRATRARIEEILGRARDAGAVRADIRLDDVALLFSAVAGIVGEPDPHRRAQRVVDHFLASFAAGR